MADYITGLVFGIFMGIIMPFIIFDKYYELGSQASFDIEECQKDLPRDQYCTIIAVPSKEIEE